MGRGIRRLKREHHLKMTACWPLGGFIGQLIVGNEIKNGIRHIRPNEFVFCYPSETWIKDNLPPETYISFGVGRTLDSGKLLYSDDIIFEATGERKFFILEAKDIRSIHRYHYLGNKTNEPDLGAKLKNHVL